MNKIFIADSPNKDIPGATPTPYLFNQDGRTVRYFEVIASDVAGRIFQSAGDTYIVNYENQIDWSKCYSS